MTTMQLNAELLRNMSIIAEDENLLRRATKYLRKLVAEKKADPTLLTKEEFFARVDKAEKEIAEGKGVTFTNKNDMNAWLNSLESSDHQETSFGVSHFRDGSPC